MGMPNVSISFSEVAATAISRGDRGIIAMIIKDSVFIGTAVTIYSVEDIPSTLSEDNQTQIKLALMGYQNAPKKVVVYVIASESSDYSKALKFFEVNKFNYMVIPTVETDEKTSEIVSWIKKMRDDGIKVKAVLPNADSADCEGIINYATASVTDDTKSYTAEQYCSRIAGIIAGTPLRISCTFAPLYELIDCSKLTKEEKDAAIDAGKFIVWWDGEKVKTGRAVNSFQTTTAEKNTGFKKIKKVEAMDMIYDDIKKTAEDSYLGKYENSYDNKGLLIAAISSYFAQLVTEHVLKDDYMVDIDIEANRNYLKGKGVKVEDMSDDEIKKADTDDQVFLKASIKIFDAIEDIKLPITI